MLMGVNQFRPKNLNILKAIAPRWEKRKGPQRGAASSLDESQTNEVVLGPLGLLFDHTLQGFGNEGRVGPVKGDGHAAAVGMKIPAVAGTLATLAPYETRQPKVRL